MPATAVGCRGMAHFRSTECRSGPCPRQQFCRSPVGGMAPSYGLARHTATPAGGSSAPPIRKSRAGAGGSVCGPFA